MTLSGLSMGQRRRLRLALLVLLVLACVAATFVWKQAFGGSAEQLAEMLLGLRIQAASLSPWAMLAVFSILLFCAFPLGLLTVIAGAVLGPWSGLIFLLSGALISGAMSFLLGRLLGKDAMLSQTNLKIAQLMARFKAKGLLTVIVVRLMPVAPFAVVNIALGATGIRLHHFLFGTLIGMLPGAVAILWFADALLEWFGWNVGLPKQMM